MITTRTTTRRAVNARHHGLMSEPVVIGGEDPVGYEALRQDLLDECNPATIQETDFVVEIAESYWRLHQARLLEVQLFEQNMPDGPDDSAALACSFHANARAFEKLRRYTIAVERCYYHALAGLRGLQKERKKSENGSVPQIYRDSQ